MVLPPLIRTAPVPRLRGRHPVLPVCPHKGGAVVSSPRLYTEGVGGMQRHVSWSRDLQKQLRLCSKQTCHSMLQEEKEMRARSGIHGKCMHASCVKWSEGVNFWWLKALHMSLSTVELFE